MAIRGKGAQATDARCRVQAAVWLLLGGLLPLLAGCASGPSVNPVSWWHHLQGGEIAKQRPPPPGQHAPYPNLASIPARPAAPDQKALDAVTQSLVADRAHAAYLAAAAPIADPSSPASSPRLFGMGTMPPPPPPAPAAASATLAAAPGPTASAAPTPAAQAPAPQAGPPTSGMSPPPKPAPLRPVRSAPLAPLAAAAPTQAGSGETAPGQTTPGQTAPGQAAPPATAAQPGHAAAPTAAATAAAEQRMAAAAAAVPPSATAAAEAAGAAPLPAAPPAPPRMSGPGAPAPSPAMVASASAPVPPPVAAKAVTVEFVPGSARLPPGAADVLQGVAARRGAAVVSVTGYGEAASDDPSVQSAALSLGLSRAQAVAKVLTADGVPANDVRVGAEAAGRGASVSLVQ